jgi:hypothetical protein
VWNRPGIALDVKNNFVGMHLNHNCGDKAIVPILYAPSL